MKKNLLFLIVLIFNFIGCVNNNETNNKNKKSKEKREVLHYIINPLKDTVFINEYSKFDLFLANRYFTGKDSKAFVCLEKNNQDKKFLKEDLSNIDDIETGTFYNLEIDSTNRHLIRKDSFNGESALGRIVFFGKKFKTPGKKKIRGFLVEYYGDYDPFEFKFTSDYGELKEFYFEADVFVKDTAQINKTL